MKVLVAFLALCAVQTQSQFFGGLNGVRGILKGGIEGADTVIGKDGPLHHAIDTTYHGGRRITDDLLARGPCERDLTLDYRKAIYEFNSKIFKQVAEQYSDHFVISPYSIWLSVAALAEGADDNLQKELFQTLQMPDELCARQQFYQIALSAESPGPDVNLLRKRLLVLDMNLAPNDQWLTFVKSAGILDTKLGPLRSNPMEYSDRLREFISAKSNPVLSGSSYIIDSLDYEGLWTTAFSEAKIAQEPFYNDAGVQIGTVDMMRMQKKVRMTHIPLVNVKVLELPVGNDGRYTMLFLMGLDKTTLRNAIQDFVGKFIVNIMESLKMSLIPIEIAVPRFAIASEFDVRKALEAINLGHFWNIPAATRYISNPPAMPTGYLQRVSARVGSKGIKASPDETIQSNVVFSGLVNIAANTATGFASILGRDFTANRPFMFSLYDTKTRTCLFSGAYSQPT